MTTTIQLRKPADDWQLRAACRDHPQPELWHPGTGEATTPALRICRRCPVRLDCLSATLQAEAGQSMLLSGIAGGHSARSRGEMRRCVIGHCGHADRDNCTVPAGVVA